MRRRLARGLVPALCAVVCAAVMAACQKVSPIATASVSPCFRVLPQAHAAIGGQGKFVDVARIRGRAVTGFPRLPTTSRVTLPVAVAPSPGAPTTLGPGRRDVCLVAYEGTFDPAHIQHLIREMGNHYAIVVVGVTSRQVRGVLLTDTLPKPLHAH